MSAPGSAEYELLTEHFSYAPVSLLDDIINAVNVLAENALSAVESVLLKVPARNLGFSSKKRSAAPGGGAGGDADADAPQEAAKREIETGTHKLETLLNASIDKNFDIFELYVMQNILTVAPDVQPYMQLSHYQGLDFDAVVAARGSSSSGGGGGGGGGEAPPTLESITNLRRRLHASQKLHVALETERARNETLLQSLRAVVGQKSTTTTTTVPIKKEHAEDDSDQQQQQINVLGFLHDHGTLAEGGAERPIATTTEFILSQLPTLRTLSSSLTTLKPDLLSLGGGGEKEEEEQEEAEQDKGKHDNDNDAHHKQRQRLQRAQYIERATRRHLETVAGADLGPAGNVRHALEWQGPGRALARDEVDGLETVAALLGEESE